MATTHAQDRTLSWNTTPGLIELLEDEQIGSYGNGEDNDQVETRPMFEVFTDTDSELMMWFDMKRSSWPEPRYTDDIEAAVLWQNT